MSQTCWIVSCVVTLNEIWLADACRPAVVPRLADGDVVATNWLITDFRPFGRMDQPAPRFAGSRKGTARIQYSENNSLVRGMMNGLREAELRTLVDKTQIHDVLMRYSRGVDRGDGELVVSCFHPEATLDYGRGPVCAKALADGVKQM